MGRVGGEVRVLARVNFEWWLEGGRDKSLDWNSPEILDKCGITVASPNPSPSPSPNPNPSPSHLNVE